MLKIARNAHLAIILVVAFGCDANPPLVNTFMDSAPDPVTHKWLDEVFLPAHPNASDYRLINVNSRKILDDVDQIRLKLLDGDIVTAIKSSSEVYEGLIRWKGKVEGFAESDVSIVVTDNPYVEGHVVIGDRVELFEKGRPGADSIIYRVNLPDRSLSPQADILPDADPADISGTAWKGLLFALPLSAYRVTTFDLETWQRKFTELRQSGSTIMRFLDDTPYRIKRTPYNSDSGPTHYRWEIIGSNRSTVGLSTGIGPGLRGYVQSREIGYVKVTPLTDTGFYIVWKMHPKFSKAID